MSVVRPPRAVAASLVALVPAMLVACGVAPQPTTAPPAASSSAAAPASTPAWIAPARSSSPPPAVASSAPPAPTPTAVLRADPKCRAELVFLDPVLQDPACRRDGPALAERTAADFEGIDVELQLGAPTVAPGKSVDATLIVRNRRDEEATLVFDVGCSDDFALEILDERGKRVDLEGGGFASICAIAPVVVGLSRGGVAKVTRKLSAIVHRSMPDLSTKPVRPLGAGSYVVTMHTRLIGPRKEPSTFPAVLARAKLTVK